MKKPDMTKTPKQQSAVEQWAAHRMARVKMWRSVRSGFVTLLEEMVKVAGVVISVLIFAALIFGAGAGFFALIINGEAPKAEAKNQAAIISGLQQRAEGDWLKLAQLNITLERLSAEVESLKPKSVVIPWFNDPPITNYPSDSPLWDVGTNRLSTNFFTPNVWTITNGNTWETLTTNIVFIH